MIYQMGIGVRFPIYIPWQLYLVVSTQYTNVTDTIASAAPCTSLGCSRAAKMHETVQRWSATAAQVMDSARQPCTSKLRELLQRFSINFTARHFGVQLSWHFDGFSAIALSIYSYKLLVFTFYCFSRLCSWKITFFTFWFLCSGRCTVVQ